ncbi:MAG: translocation/assembly module TamB domain-containing protein [Magnetococcales bacterium]|nr:translocation/assembly module TamB domain-containing protein [Magnetococcales bacterium]
MTTDDATPPTDSDPPPAAPRTAWLPTLLKGVGIALLLLIMLLLASLMSLQSENTRNLLTRSLSHWLSSPDSRLEIGNIRGRIPWEIEIDRLTWGDAQGTWLEINQTQLAWSLDDWWHGRLHIQRLGAEQIHLLRQPVVKPDPTPPPAPATPSLPTGLRYLPTLLVDRLYVTQLILEPAAYGHAARFALEGEIKHLSSDNRPTANSPAHPSQLLAKLQLRPLDARDTQLTLQATLSPAGTLRGDSQLALTMEGHERSGLLAPMTGLTAAKGVDFSLTGAGPLSAWQGNLAITLDGVGEMKGQVDLHYADASQLRLTGRIQGNPDLLGTEWRALFAPADPAVTLALQLAWPDAKQVRLDHLNVETPFAHLKLHGALVLPAAELNGEAALEIAQLAALTPVTGKPLAGSLAATLTVQGPWQQPHLHLTSQATELALDDWRANQLLVRWEGPMNESSTTAPQRFQGDGSLVGLRTAAGDSPLGPEPLHWSAQLALPAGGLPQLTRLELTGQRLTALLEGEIGLGEARGHGQWSVTLPRIGDWLQQPLPEQTITGRGQWSGLFELTALTDEPTKTAQPQLTTTLTGGLSELQGLPPVLHILLGSELQTAAKLTLQGGEKLAVTALDLRAARTAWQGTLQADLLQQQLTGQLQAQVPQLAPFAEWAGQPLEGSLELDAHWEGPMTAPRLSAALKSPALAVGKLHWQQPRLLLTADGLTATPHGSLKLELQNLGEQWGEKGQPATATSSYRWEKGGVQLSDLRMLWPTGTVTGERLRYDLTRNVVEGQLTAQSSQPGPLLHWLAGDATPFPADLRGTLLLKSQWNAQAHKQGLEGELEAQLARGAQSAAGGFDRLEKGSIKAKVADLWGKPSGHVEGHLGRLDWGNSRIHSIQWRLAGDQTAASFELNGKGLLELPEREEKLPVSLPSPQSAKGKGRGKAAPEGVDLEANGKLGMDDKGVMRATLAALTAHIGSDVVQLEQPAHIVLAADQNRPSGGSRLELDRLLLRYGLAHLDAHARYDTRQLEIEGDVRLPLTQLSRLGGPDLQGSARAHVQLSGKPSQPEGTVTLNLDRVHVNDPAFDAIPPATLQASARLERGQVNANLVLQELTSTPITALLLLPVRLSFAPFAFALPGNGKVGGTLNANAQLTQFALMAAPDLMDSQKVDGQLNIALHFGGTVAKPEVQGEISVQNGSYENGSLGTVLKEIQLSATAHGRTIEVESLTASDGGEGRLRAKGSFSLDGVQRLPFQLEAMLDKALLVRRDELQATLSGTVAVRGDGNRVAVTGDLTGNELLIYLADSPSVDMQAIPIDTEMRHGLNLVREKESHPPTPPAPVALDIALHLPNRVFMRGRGLDSEWQGNLAVRGMASEPLVEGRLEVKRGYFEFLDQHFDLRKGIIALDGTSPPQPHLDLEAESKPVNNLVALLSLRGPAFTPVLTLSSEPEVPQDEILARLLFNRNRQQLTPAQALGLAVAIEKLRTGGPGLLGRARDSLGIDRLEVGGESVEAGSVKAGKYISDKVFVGVERGLKQGSGKVSVSLEMTPNITLETEMDESNQSGVGVNWKYDY